MKNNLNKKVKFDLSNSFSKNIKYINFHTKIKKNWESFPENIISIISWTPLIYLVDFPVSTAVGLYTLNEWIYNLGFSLLWCLIVTFFSFYIYNKGISQYEAYGQ